MILKKMLKFIFYSKIMVFACLQAQVAYKLITNIKKVEKLECFLPTKSSNFACF
jgi:hypothetical protein